MHQDIIEVIQSLKNLRHLRPATKTDVLVAENALGVHFAEDFKTYALAYGVITAKGVEITGISESPRLNVADVTMKERALNSNIPENMYVIESTGAEGIVILQDETGCIYALAPNGTPKALYSSLADYLRSLQ